jgi:hypothetical protein
MVNLFMLLPSVMMVLKLLPNYTSNSVTLSFSRSNLWYTQSSKQATASSVYFPETGILSLRGHNTSSVKINKPFSIERCFMNMNYLSARMLFQH